MRKMISVYLILACISMLFCFSAAAEVTTTGANHSAATDHSVPQDGALLTDGNRDMGNNGFGMNNNNGNNLRTYAANDGNDFDWGWVGLLGLIGLTGLRGKNRDRERT
jgi:hypothetical protein